MVAKLMDKLENEYHMIKYNKNTHEIAIVHWAKYNMNKLGGKPIMDCISSELKKVQDVSLLKIVLKDVAKENIRALFLKEIKEKNQLSILMISHDLALLQELCDELLVLHEGKVAEAGTPEEVIWHPKQEYTKRLIESVL